MRKRKPFGTRFVYLLILTMMIQMILPFQHAPIRAEEVGKDLGSIFAFSFLKMDGVDVEDGDLLDVSGDHMYTLQYDWETGEQTVTAGDYASIQVPEAFEFDRDWQDLPITLSTGEKVGVYSLVDGVMTFVFDEGINAVSGVKNGYVGFGVTLKTEWFNDSVTKRIHFQDKVDKTLEITVRPENEVTQVTKTGIPDSTTDAKEITWTVDYVNSRESEVTDVLVTDLLPEGLELTQVIDSLDIKGLQVGYDGTVTERTSSERFDSKAVDKDTRTLTVGLGTLKPYEGYRLSYTTPITDYAKTSFTNDVHITYADQDLSASATVNGLIRSNYIEKSGRSLGNDRIEWTIDVNKAGGTINQAIVEEQLPTGLVVDEDSIQIERLTQNGSTWQGTLDTEKTEATTGFPVVLGALANNDAYRIQFKTQIDYSKVNAGNYEVSTTFHNVATLLDGSIEYGNSEAAVTVNRQPILRKEGNSHINYDNKTITWKIHVNEAHQYLTGVQIEDIIPSGLSIEVDAITIYDDQGVEVSVDPSAITLTPVSEGTNVSIQLGDIGKAYRLIEYETSLDDQHGVNGYSLNAFNNQVSLGGTGIEGNVEDNKKVNIGNNSYNKSFIGIDYNQKTMAWRIQMRPKRDALSTLLLTDSFPNKGLVFLPDSLTVKVGSRKLTKDIDYTLEENTVEGETGYEKGFVLSFLGLDVTPINEDVTIEYMTSYDPEKGVDENISSDQNYINKVHITGETVHNLPVDTTRQANKKVIDESWNSGKKQGRLISLDDVSNQYNGWESGYTRQIRWEVYVNYQEQTMGDKVRIVDTIDYEGAIIHDSVAVHEYTVTSNGNTTIGDEVDPSDYNVDFENDDKSITVTFLNSVEKRYVLLYRTSIPEISKATYRNMATVHKDETLVGTYVASVNYSKSGDFLDKSALVSGTKVYTDDELTWNITINESLSIIDQMEMTDWMSEGLVYKEGSLKLSQDNQGQEEELTEGEDYTVETKVVNERTQLSIRFLHAIETRIHVAYVTVVVAETGKVNNTAELSGDKIESQSIQSKKLSAQQFSYVGGDPTKGEIHVTKVDDDRQTIQSSEASFKLWYVLNGKDYLFGNRVFTTIKGELDIVNLPLNRTYYLEEVTAPEGYEALDQRIEIDVTKPSHQEAYKVEVVNNKIYGAIRLMKEDDRSKPLEGAVFGLYNASKSKVDEATSLVDGTVTFKNVAYGTYTIKEIKAPEGYVESDVIITASVEKQGVTVIPTVDTVANRKIKGTVILKKEDNDGNALEKAEFGLFTSKNTLMDKATSDSAGIVRFEEVPYGNYTIKEILAPVGYVPAADIMNVSIKTDEQIVDLRNQPIENVQIVGDIEVIKQDATTSEPLQGAVFVLEKGGNVIYTSDPTDNQGRYVFDNVEYGVYTLREIKAPTGYLINSKTESVTVKEQNAAIQRFIVPNTKIQGHLQLNKIDEDNNPLEGAVFTLYARSDTDYASPLKTAISDVNGIVSMKDIDYGDYQVVETKAPEGYNLNTTPWNVEIRKEDETVIKTDSVINTRIIGNLTVLKRDRTTYNPLSGAIIRLYDENGTFVEEHRSGIDGLVHFEQLEYGRYYYEESEAPSGYVLDQTRYEVDITEQGITVQKTLDNRKRSRRPSGPITPINPKTPEDPENPKEPEVPETPDSSEVLDEVVPQGVTEVTSSDHGNTTENLLPNTGREDRRYYDIIGMLFVLTGFLFTRKKGL